MKDKYLIIRVLITQNLNYLNDKKLMKAQLKNEKEVFNH